MGLHDRLKTSNGASAAPAETLLGGTTVQEAAPDSKIQDPYAELKTRIHHACIATLGAELFKREATGDLNERVTRAVTEQLVLDRTPLTREERRQIIREITDDILGYGPLEPFLRDDSVTEVMVNAYDRIYFGSISPKAAQCLAACVKGKLNALISGGTGTGKTTTLNAMSAFIPGDERIVTIEDAAELQLQ